MNTEVIKQFEGKRVFILTKSDYRYQTNNLKILEDSVNFLDKYQNNVILSISEIKQITEVNDGYGE